MCIRDSLVVHDKERAIGLAHRLDAICSGLLLAAVNIEASALLKWQIKGGILIRAYKVYCHRLVPLTLQEVDVNIFHSGDARNCVAEVSTSASPSHTVITVQARDILSDQPCQEASQSQKWRATLESFLQILPKCRYTSAVAAASLDSCDTYLITGADAISCCSITASTSATAQEWEVDGDVHAWSV